MKNMMAQDNILNQNNIDSSQLVVVYLSASPAACLL